jgi:hypothetical protein
MPARPTGRDDGQAIGLRRAHPSGRGALIVRDRVHSCALRWGSLVAIAVLLMAAPPSEADGKLSLYGIRMMPSGKDAEDFSRPGWGGGVQVVFPVPQLADLFAGVGGLEYVNLLNATTVIYDSETLLRVEQQTDQYYARLYLGSEFGPHGRGFLRPHVGVDLAASFYGISTDVVVPDDSGRQQEIRQDLRDEDRVAMGYDVNAGVDLNFRNRVSVDAGVKFLKSFNVPQQLGSGSVPISPGYFQIYLGVGISLGTLQKSGSQEQ